jgi:hypothetical protein
VKVLFSKTGGYSSGHTQPATFVSEIFFRNLLHNNNRNHYTATTERVRTAVKMVGDMDLLYQK